MELILNFQTTYHSFSDQLDAWKKIMMKQIDPTDIISFSTAYQTCLSAKLEKTELVKEHGDVVNRLLLKIATKIETERNQLLNNLEKLNEICLKIQEENKKVKEVFHNNVEKFGSEILFGTELRPSILKMVEWCDYFEKMTRTEYYYRSLLLGENYEKIASSSFLVKWKNDHLHLLYDILKILQPFLQSKDIS